MITTLLLLACSGPTPEPPQVWSWGLPSHFPEPAVPAANPMSPVKVELGRALFYDTRLSIDGDMSCASCHEQSKAFTDGRAQALGTTGELHPRGAMGLSNVAYASRLAWANPLVATLEHQAMLPLFGEAPVEMGMAGQEQRILELLRSDPRYAEPFKQAWPQDAEPHSLDHMTQAIAAFERTLLSFNSPYDRYVQGDATALSDSAKRGMQLFESERLECFHCHGGFNFTDNMDHTGLPFEEVAFHNTGLYNIDGDGAYPAPNTGVHEVSGDPEDMGRFKAPTLRNIAVTAPYMHDGSLATLSDVLAHYGAGGRLIDQGPHVGDGASNPFKSQFVPGFVLDEQEEADVLAFLNSLTDPTFLSDPRFSDPFATPTP